jgi:hypothetical protein
MEPVSQRDAEWSETRRREVKNNGGETFTITP